MKRIICFLFGHRYEISRRITNTTRELKCLRCKREFGTNDDAEVLLPLTIGLREANNNMMDKPICYQYKVYTFHNLCIYITSRYSFYTANQMDGNMRSEAEGIAEPICGWRIKKPTN